MMERNFTCSSSVVPTTETPLSCVTVKSVSEVNALSENVNCIIAAECEYDQNKELSFGRFSNLKRLEVGNNCFSTVEIFAVDGLPNLEYVVVKNNSFTKPNFVTTVKDVNRHFYVKSCPKLKEVTIGRGSFEDYSSCEFENVPSLEVLEIGDRMDSSESFLYASLELQSE